MALTPIEAEIVADFELFDDQMDKYQHIIDCGRELEPIDEALKTDDKLVRGCQSKVWLITSFDGDLMHYKADSNTVITKGIIALLVKVLTGRKPMDVVNSELEFIDQVDLRGHLTSQRSNGLTSMIDLMKQQAKQHL